MNWTDYWTDYQKEAGRRLRALVQEYDVETAAKIERGFQHWQAETLMPQAVDRWTAEIGEDV